MCVCDKRKREKGSKGEMNKEGKASLIVIGIQQHEELIFDEHTTNLVKRNYVVTQGINPHTSHFLSLYFYL